MRFFFPLFFLLISAAAFPQKNIQLRSVLPYSELLNGSWGYADQAGNEFAFVGVNNGLSIVDVTNPDSIAEIFFLPGPRTIWRCIKTWNDHAYVTNESSAGLLIVDLSMLPDSLNYVYWTGDSVFSTAHTIFIDEKGFAYLFGYNNVAKNLTTSEKGALILDLNHDPKNPVVVGSYNENYIHDGFVRGDTLWAAQIYAGTFAVIDVSQKDSLLILDSQETPNRLTHNCWLSNDGKILFTTDERPDAFITAYDVSQIGNITEIDRYQAAPLTGLIPHNTYVKNNFLVNSYYKYGVNIVDATIPGNLVETGFYDTSPFPNSDGFNGCWDVYPYLPSGNLIATDIETGLLVLTPTFVRAAYLTGTVTDQSTGNELADVRVEIMATNIVETSSFNGIYKTGFADGGAYDIRFYKIGCLPKIISGVQLQNGIVDTLNVALTCTTFVNQIEAVENEILFQAAPTVFQRSTAVRFGFQNENHAAEISIFDVNGKPLHTFKISDHEGEIMIGNSYPVGIYFARLRTNSASRTIRLVKTQ